ncbi:DUF2975 domain-containing protein [Actinomadura harenae]|uniref:DUF2975 domain-containing protein n=1 Tax=Actinomadura harenae TaxID=2483351 RepID=A0A3M2MI80_9ACTN|nr:DUF2975 domain-containing protein [Actinomadura harenae]RMI47008.1 DUF2975 domain-containing protein [Actinomadura harenae]
MTAAPVRRSPRHNPLTPLDVTLDLLVKLMIAFLLFSALTTAFGSGSMFGFGERDICVRDDSISVGSGEDRMPSLFKPGVAASNSGLSLCVNNAPLSFKALNVATMLPTFVLYFTAILLLWRLVRHARRVGPFHLGNVRRLQFLGWWLAVGGVVAKSAEEGARRALISAMYKDHGLSPLSMIDFQLSLIITGVGLLAVAGILRAGVRMREDLEGTV